MERAFKYHGLGNDFVVLDRRQSGVDLTPEQSRALCDRRRGVGADGVLVLLPSARGAARMVVHNADGSVAEMCGNGIRCAVKYLADADGARPPQLEVETGAGVLTCDITYGDGVEAVQVSMGPARLVAPNLPSGKTGGPWVAQAVEGTPFHGTAVSMGNPHLVLLDGPPESAGQWGPALERHPLFPQRTNVEFCRLESDGALTVAVWERGSGLTQACGTGACAAAAAFVHQGRLQAATWLTVRLPGGALLVRVAPDFSQVDMKGPVAFVFEAKLPA